MPFSSSTILPVLVAFLSLSYAASAFDPTTPSFKDVTIAAGIKVEKLIKYGGPTVADLDSDGYPDLLFCHHDQSFAEIYFNNRNGTFVKHPFRLWTDMHALIVVPRSVFSRDRRFTVSSGGNFGKDPKPPRMFHVTSTTRAITEVTNTSRINRIGARGRTSVFMYLKKDGDHRHPDVLFTNAKPKDRSLPSHFAYKNLGPYYEPRPKLGGFEYHWNSHAMPTDLDGDGEMELVSYHNLTIYKLVAPFTFRNISDSVLPPGLPRVGTVAVAEFDIDNDEDFDLYVARTNTGDLGWLKGDSWPDHLLENRDGKYVNTSKLAGIPSSTQTRGVTTADFNNDGYMDILICQYVARDIMLLNRGDGTFKRVDGLIYRPPDVRGDHVAAVDYDMDGRVDLIVSQGDQFDRALGGSYRVLRNTQSVSPSRRYLLVRVGTAPDRSATSLHAVVTVVAGGMRMIRRVGSPGDAVARSFLETVHFGLRDSGQASVVRVKWTNGVTSFKWNVPANSKVVFGIV